MDTIDRALDVGGLRNDAARAFIRQWAAHTQPAAVEVVSAADDARLVAEALAAGEFAPVTGGRYYARSYVKDTARSEERTFVATSNPADRGGQGTPADKRYFAPVAAERLILHFGSSYGGNALLGKIAHGLRQASYDGQASGRFLAEQFMLIGIRDKETGRTRHICGGFPSASGKANLAMMLPPPALAGRYEVHYLGDDIAWLYLNDDGRVYAFNPENGVFGVAKDTNERSNANAMAAIGAGTGTLFTNVAYNAVMQEVWWEGRTPQPPEDVAGWRDWRGELISDRPAGRRRSGAAGDEWSHPNSRFTTALANVPNLSPEADNPLGVPIDAVIFGGRARAREPLIRALTSLAEGV